MFGESYACLPEEAIPIRAVAAESAEVLLLEVRRVLTTCPSACAFHAPVSYTHLDVYKRQAQEGAGAGSLGGGFLGQLRAGGEGGDLQLGRIHPELGA